MGIEKGLAHRQPDLRDLRPPPGVLAVDLGHVEGAEKRHAQLLGLDECRGRGRLVQHRHVAAPGKIERHRFVRRADVIERHILVRVDPRPFEDEAEDQIRRLVLVGQQHVLAGEVLDPGDALVARHHVEHAPGDHVHHARARPAVEEVGRRIGRGGEKLEIARGDARPHLVGALPHVEARAGRHGVQCSRRHRAGKDGRWRSRNAPQRERLFERRAQRAPWQETGGPDKREAKKKITPAEQRAAGGHHWEESPVAFVFPNASSSQSPSQANGQNRPGNKAATSRGFDA